MSHHFISLVNLNFFKARKLSVHSISVVHDKVDKDVNNELAIVEEVNVKKRMEEEASGLF